VADDIPYIVQVSDDLLNWMDAPSTFGWINAGFSGLPIAEQLLRFDPALPCRFLRIEIRRR
jgi:hypothetical protein